MDPGQAAPAAGGYGELALTALLVLVVVCALLLVVARYAGRWIGGRRGEDGLIKVRARVSLEPRRALYVIEVGGRTMLVGSSEGGIQMLAEVEASELPAPAVASGGFAALVAQALARRGRGGAGAGAAPSGDAAVKEPEPS
jgi:flagellar biosynthetic protein FliO